MSIKTLILERFMRSKDTALPRLSAQMTGSEKLQALRALTEETVLPRRICVSAPGKSLEMLVFEGRVYELHGQTGGGDTQAFALAKPGADDQSRAAAFALLSEVLAPGEAQEITTVRAEAPGGEGVGLRPDILFSPPEAPAPASAPAPAPGAQASAVGAFLAKVEPDLGRVVSFVKQDCPAGLPAELVELGQKLGKGLEGPLLCVAMAARPSQDTYIFALDETQGMAAELNRQKLGKLCTAWSKMVQMQE